MKPTSLSSAFCLSTFALLAVWLGFNPSARATIVTWNAVVNSSADTNWSDVANWSGGSPTQNATTFNDTTGVGADIINNVVDTLQTPASLTFVNTNSYQNTLIAPGQTLLIYSGGLLMGGTTFTNGGNGAFATISGAGATMIVSNGNIAVQEAAAGTGNTPATLIMSNLDTFIGTNISNLYLGYNNASSTFARVAGILYLAKTNYINFLTNASGSASPQIDIGNNSQNNGPGSILYLGQTNAIYSDNIGVGLTKQSSGGGGNLEFNPAFVNPVAFFRAHDGVSPVATWAIADGQAVGGTASLAGNCNFTNGIVNALVNSMWIARNSTKDSGSSPAANGTLSIGGGIFTVNNLTNAMISTNLETPTCNGTINVAGPGELVVNTNLVMAYTNALGSTPATATANFNVTGGEALINNLICGGGNSTVTLAGGVLVITNTLGTAAKPLGTLNIANGSTLQLPIANVANAAVINLFINDNASTVNVSSLPTPTIYPSQYPIITYQTLDDAQSLNLGTLPGTYTGFISNDYSSTVWLVVTNGPTVAKADEWGGNISDVWDTSTLNWTNNGVSVAYTEGDSVIFDDSAQTSTISLSTIHSPINWMVNNSILNYVFTGSGGVSGAVGLVKDGGNSLTLSESGGDSFSGGITLNSGTVILDNAPGSTVSGGVNIANGATLQIGNSDANGAMPAGAVTDNGSLVFEGTGNFTAAGAISGSGSLTQNGTGKVTLSATNAYTGNTTVNSGTLAITTAGAIPNGPSLSVNSATLDVSAVPGTLSLNNVYLSGATLNLNVPYNQTQLNLPSLTTGNSNTINIASLPVIDAYPVTLPILIAPSGIYGSGYNFSLGTLPAASPAYTGAISNSSDGSTVLLTLTGGPVGRSARPYIIWSGADALGNVSSNWSDAQNWQLPGAPTATDNVIFNGTDGQSVVPLPTTDGTPGGGPGAANLANFNNFVDTSFTISTLTYTNIGSSAYQSTWLVNGAALTITNTGGLTIGSGSLDFGGTVTSLATIAGTNGTLNLPNTNSTIYVGLGGANASEQAILDLSALGTFNASVSTFLIGVGSGSSGISLARESGEVFLAATNIIKATLPVNSVETVDTVNGTALDIGDDDGNGSLTSFLYLGQTNVIFADAIGVGRQKTGGAMLFNPIFTNPAAYFRGQNGTGAVSNWDVGDGVVNSGTATCSGTNDFTGGYVNALVTDMYIGRAANNATSGGTASGTLTFDNGTINVNTLYAGYQPASSSKIGQGSINVNTNSSLGTYGTLVVGGSLSLAVNTGGTGAASTFGTLNIGGVVQAASIFAGTNAAVSTINLTNGTLEISGTAGSTAAPLTLLNLNGGVLELSVSGSSTATNLVAVSVTTNGITTVQIASLNNVVTGTNYPLLAYTGTDPYGSLSLAALPANYTGTLVDDTAHGLVSLALTSIPNPQPPVITSISLQAGNTLVFNGTNGSPGLTYYLLGTTNLTLPVLDWAPLATNTFGGGSFSLTNAIKANTPQEFYILQVLP